jgi:LuxR family maltose regulon positive regulatory protein
VELADRFGTPRALLSGGRPFIGLLVEGQESWGTREDLVRVVLDHAQSVATEPRPALTRRELEVLHELPTLRTVEEIASGLVVSVNTLKTHLRSLYRKLGVNSRREAVAEARRLGVL